MLGINLLEVILITFGFCVAAWVINKFAKDPYRYYALFAIAIFAVIYLLERFHIFTLLRSIQI